MFVALRPTTQSRDLITPYSRHDQLAIRSISAPSTCPRLQVEEIAVDATGTYNNPFDPDEVSLDATVTSPSGQHFDMPGFLYQSFERKLEEGKETLSQKDGPTWRLRICPTETGRYQVSVRFRDHSGSLSKDLEFDSEPSTATGFLRVSSRDPHYFETIDGNGIFPVGLNLFWGTQRGTYDYDDWLGALGQNGLNMERILIGSSQSTFELQKSGSPREGRGANLFDLGSCWKLDHVLESARKQEIYTLLCLEQSSELNIRGSNADWQQNPLNRDNGGPLRVWTDFWTSSAGAKIYGDKLRYLIARYGSDRNLMGWELWRDVDAIQEYDAGVVRSWIGRTSAELKRLDPYKHPITVGFVNPAGDRDTYLLKSVDFAEVHVYSPKPVGPIADKLARHAEWGKPSIVSETAPDEADSHASQDPSGIAAHDPAWISLASGAAGGALPWWGAELTASATMMGSLSTLARFVTGVDMAAEGFRPSESSITTPGVNSWSLVGTSTAFVWAQRRNWNWQSVVQEKQPFSPLAASSLQLNDLASGSWDYQVWDTWKDQVITKGTISVSLEGKATIPLPPFLSDLAVRLTHKR